MSLFLQFSNFRHFMRRQHFGKNSSESSLSSDSGRCFLIIASQKYNIHAHAFQRVDSKMGLRLNGVRNANQGG